MAAHATRRSCGTGLVLKTSLVRAKGWVAQTIAGACGELLCAWSTRVSATKNENGDHFVPRSDRRVEDQRACIARGVSACWLTRMKPTFLKPRTALSARPSRDSSTLYRPRLARAILHSRNPFQATAAAAALWARAACLFTRRAGLRGCLCCLAGFTTASMRAFCAST